MKKLQYIKPSIYVAVVSTEHMVSTSVQSVSGTTGFSKGSDVTSGVTESREDSGWDVW